MGSALESELYARLLMDDRQRALRRLERWGWQEQEPPAGEPPPAGLVRRAVGTWLVRLGARVPGLTAPPPWKKPEGARHR